MQQEDWDALKAQMSNPYGVMELQCDQYKLTLVQEISGKSNSWGTAVYVDGVIKGLWFGASKSGEPEHEESRRFMRKVSKSLNTKKEVEAWRKAFGKREADKRAAQKYFYFTPTWSSFNSLKKHLLANNTSIERIH